MAVSTSVSKVSTNASGANGLKRASDSIPNMNVWTALAKASINATAEYFNSMSKRRELEALSNSLMYQAQTASSGVLMTSASKAELDQSNVMGAQMHQHIIQENTNSAVRQAQANVTSLQNQSIELLSQSMQLIGQEADLKMQQANFMAQAAILEGDSKASNIMAKSIKPFMNAGFEFGLTMAKWGSENYMGSIGGK